MKKRRGRAWCGVVEQSGGKRNEGDENMKEWQKDGTAAKQ